MDVLVSPRWLDAHLSEVRVVDCRFALDDPDAGHRAYLAGHVAGASFLDLDRDLSGTVGDGSRGRRPLPDPEAFAAAARRAGIRRGQPVVAYDAGMQGGAARLWWLLRSIGHDEVAVLDGGFAAWDGPVRSGEEEIPPGDVAVGPGRGATVSAEELLERLGQPGRVILDARPPERFRGDVEPVDPAAGHIPGARNVPLDEPLPPDLVTTPDEVVASCGSGVTACVLLLRLAAAGRDDAVLYPGSWSEWSTRGLPVATGEG